MHQSRKLAYPQGYREFESLPVRFFEPPSSETAALVLLVIVLLKVQLSWPGA
jgi:hypothetical protein